MKRIITFLDMNVLHTNYPISTPLYINIEPTSYCNLNCSMCPLDDSRKKGFMDFDLYKKIVDQSSKMKINIARLFLAGEPFLYKEIDKMISYAHKKNMKVEIHTNGTLLTKEMSDKILLDPPDYLSFSIDGNSEKEYNEMRINADFNQMMDKVIYFLKEKKRKKIKIPFVIIQNMIWYKPEEKEQKNLIKYFKDLPINDFKQMYPYVWGDEVKNTQNTSQFRPQGKHYVGCSAPWDHISICWDGTVVSCCEDLNGKQIIGNVNEEPLQKIWHGKNLIKIRKAIKKRNFDGLNLCQSCHRLYSNDIFERYPFVMSYPLKYMHNIILNFKRLMKKRDKEK